MNKLEFSLSIFEDQNALSPFQKAKSFQSAQGQKRASIEMRLWECFPDSSFIRTNPPSSITNIATKALLYFNALTSRPESVSPKIFYPQLASLYVGLSLASTTLFYLISIPLLLHKMTNFHFNSIDHITSLPVNLLNQNPNNFIFTDLDDEILSIRFHPFPESKSNEGIPSSFKSYSIPAGLNKQPEEIDPDQINFSSTLSFNSNGQTKTFITLIKCNADGDKQPVPLLPKWARSTIYQHHIIYYPADIDKHRLAQVTEDIFTFNKPTPPHQSGVYYG